MSHKKDIYSVSLCNRHAASDVKKSWEIYTGAIVVKLNI